LSPDHPPRASANPLLRHLHAAPEERENRCSWESALPLQIQPIAPVETTLQAIARLAIADLTLVALEGSPCNLRIKESHHTTAIVVVSGEVRIQRRANHWRLTAGDLLITTGGTLDWRSSAFSVVFVIFSPQQITKATQLLKLQMQDLSIDKASELSQPVICRSGQDDAVDSLLRAMHLVLCIASDLQATSPSLLPHLGLDRQLATLSALLACPELRQSAEQEPGSQQDSDHSIDHVIAYIDDHLSQPLNLADIQGHSHYSRRALQYAFRRRFNCTVTQWIRARRLDLAHSRLSLGAAGDSVSSIAKACGYRSMSLFSIEFQQRFHCKPSQLLREARAGRASTDPETVPPEWVEEMGEADR
jgi:AraC-like DNA-binding protein